jgi:hypothetical protein
MINIQEKIAKEKELDTLSYVQYQKNISTFLTKIEKTNPEEWDNIDGVNYYSIEGSIDIFINYKGDNCIIGYCEENEQKEFNIYDDDQKKILSEFITLLSTINHRKYFEVINKNFKAILDKL